jgi:pimeloyl-ACP methyl ester carboxylesterase
MLSIPYDFPKLLSNGHLKIPFPPRPLTSTLPRSYLKDSIGMKPAATIVLVCSLAALVSAFVWLYSPDKSRSDLETRYLHSRGDYRLVSGITLHVRDTGPRKAPVIILLHGFGASLHTWDPWAERLSADYRVICIDLPGFGLTGPDPTGDYSLRRSSQILSALMDNLGVTQAALVGNSLAGKLAWNFAVEMPARVTKLVLISPDGFASPGFEYGKKPAVPILVRLLPYMLPKALRRTSLAPAYGDPDKLTDETVTRYRDLMLAPGVRKAIISRMEQVMLENPTPLLRRIQAPTLLLWGEKDAMIPLSNAADYLRDIPSAKLVSLPGLGHAPFEEAPVISLEPVLRFLATDETEMQR